VRDLNGVELFRPPVHMVSMDTPLTPPIPFDNSYARLPERFYSRVNPTPVAAPQLIRINEALARELGIDPQSLASTDGIAILAGNCIAEGSDPIAMAYAGHQFANFVPKLGDGRAILIGEVVDNHGIRRDIQLKGAGRTPYSRMGDGRAALGPVLREYIVSEAFAALGIPTTRALAAVTTGDWVLREEPIPGAILVRVASSHIRVGTFQFFAARKDTDAVRTLADYTIARHYPNIKHRPDKYRDFLSAVIARQGDLIAKWMYVGFIHGVMNTDNCSIAGETIDFGPCAFMDIYHPSTVFSSIDQGGRYAFANQPAIANWNLVRFAETLLPLLGETQEDAIAAAQERIDAYPAVFQAAITDGYAAKLGLASNTAEDTPLIQDFLTVMANGAADYTLSFRTLSDAAEDPAKEAFTRPFQRTPPASMVAVPLASAPCDRPPRPARHRSRYARREPRHHSAQPSGRSRHQSRRRQQRLRPIPSPRR
jgi:serine/tyrosine/threonine adenylyltransferase